MEHILIVGGTGVLAGVTRWLNGREHKLSIIARDQDKLRQISSGCTFPDDNHLISLDYGNSHQLRSNVQDAQKKYGRFTMIVA
ncbi:hypothetical protein ACFQZR_15865 [Paenibacillus sp. GCM10027629]|uniref:hypothetical protein n=1 Tax=Paenibacillus sp. GCM10027629 TaxID=3273414 RepID=UPI00362FCDB0